MRSCVFCGGLPLTREHVYPQWLRQFSGPQSFISREGAYQPSTPEAVVRQNVHSKYVEVLEQRGAKTPNLHEVTVKAVCSTCNNGWMSTLEGEVRPILKKLADHTSLVLDRKHKTRLAAWAHKCFSCTTCTKICVIACLLTRTSLLSDEYAYQPVRPVYTWV